MKQRYFILFFLLLLLILGIFIYFFYQQIPSAPTANIYVDGKLYRSVPMQGLTQPVTIEIKQKDKTNTVIVTSQEVYMCSADCPDQLCVKQGAIRSSRLPIVCLPNHIIIKITGGYPSENLDAVSG